ncbi:MAG TPA: RidA family protein [Dehalococcoidia bacterium]|nr:RidA family protein [Dehalococcoidia bacterium]
MEVEAKLEKLGLTLPPVRTPAFNYIPTRRSGNILYVSGHGPIVDGKLAYKGKIGRELTVEQGADAARITMLNCLASIKAAIGDLDKVTQILKLLGMVASEEGFGQQPLVINGASDLLVELFGERGRHARSAVGLFMLPGGMPVEIEMVVEVAD